MVAPPHTIFTKRKAHIRIMIGGVWGENIVWAMPYPLHPFLAGVFSFRSSLLIN